MHCTSLAFYDSRGHCNTSIRSASLPDACSDHTGFWANTAHALTATRCRMLQAPNTHTPAGRALGLDVTADAASLARLARGQPQASRSCVVRTRWGGVDAVPLLAWLRRCRAYRSRLVAVRRRRSHSCLVGPGAHQLLGALPREVASMQGQQPAMPLLQAGPISGWQAAPFGLGCTAAATG